MNRRGDWMQTFTGRQFWPLDPREEEVDIRDIAHSLSLQCRYAGHVDRFYSVAEHCVLVSLVVERTSREHALVALLHDASEAYLVDVPRPVKRYLAGYKQAEDWLMTVILGKYRLPNELPDIVKSIDDRILNDERTQLMGPSPALWAGDPRPADIDIRCFEPKQAERVFLSRFHDLTRGEWA